MKCYTTLIFASIVASVAALYAAESEFVAKDTLSGFRLETSHKALIISSEEDMALLHNNPITYQKGETVTVTAPDGEVTVLVDSPTSSGAYAFKPTSGGLWKFSTSEDELVLSGMYSVSSGSIHQNRQARIAYTRRVSAQTVKSKSAKYLRSLIPVICGRAIFLKRCD